MLTSLIRFVLISFLLSSATVFSADDVLSSKELSASNIAPQPISNSQLPEWFYRELTSIRKDVSVLDATGASKEQIQELKERIQELKERIQELKERIQELKERIVKVEVRLKESQKHIDDKLIDQSERIGDIAESNSFFIALFAVIAGVLGTLIAVITIINSWKANREAVAKAEDAAQQMLDVWTQVKEKELTEKFDQKLEELSGNHEKEFQKLREKSEEQAFDNDINEAFGLVPKGRNDDAIERLNSVIRRIEASDSNRYHRVHAKGLYNKAIINLINKKREACLKVLDELVSKFRGNDEIVLQEFVAKAFVMKGIALGQLNRPQEGINVYDNLLELFKNNEEVSIKREVVAAMCNKAELVLLVNGKELAIEAIQEAVTSIGEDFKLENSMMEVLNFIIEESSTEDVLSKIDNIPDNETISWDFHEIRSIVEQLEPPRKEQVEAFARFFEKHKDKAKLKEELDLISKE